MKTVYYCQKAITHRVQKSPKVGIDPGTFIYYFNESKISGFDPQARGGGHCVLLTDQNASCWCISAVSAGSLLGLKTWFKT